MATLNELRADPGFKPDTEFEVEPEADPQTELIEAAILLDDVQEVLEKLDCKEIRNQCTRALWKKFKEVQQEVEEFLEPWNITSGDGKK